MQDCSIKVWIIRLKYLECDCSYPLLSVVIILHNKNLISSTEMLDTTDNKEHSQTIRVYHIGFTFLG